MSRASNADDESAAAPRLEVYNPYPAYKDSGVEWLGQIPAHWDVKRLKSFASVQLSNVDKKSKDGQDTIRLCNYVDVYYNERIDADLDFMTATATLDQVRRFSLRTGDVLITKDSETWTDIAVPAVVTENLSGVLCGYHLAHIRPTPECNGEFLSRALAATGPRDQYHVAANGITRFGLTGNAIRDSTLPFPPLPEQRAIADYLDRETARIDALAAKKERLIELLREKRAALISHAVTRGLDPNAPLKDSGVEWLAQIPAHWAVKRVTWLFSIGSGTTPASGDSNYYGDGVPWVTSAELRESIVLQTDKTVTSAAIEDFPSLKIHPKNSVAVAMYGATIGRLGILGIPATVNQACCVFSNPKKVESQFWFYWLQFRRPYLISLGYGGGQPNLSQELLRSIRLPLPPLLEQRAIADYLDRETARIDALIEKVHEAIDRLKELRAALISAAVTGKIDVRKPAA
ncbi:MAG: restriction endonuclease subunit S [Chloroflexi bacterium]|nr:restriction endonuclease subunit S [Chloroflexota bacterium]